ncbi:dipeptide ABC transporter ATP-binding protein [Actinomadura rugatobispora]|uniref:Dipeptide ABC transporter ATP-binding protein n=1 Tax=Actinomadura rugatobispora TaxID=1994 RepID=A0ABW0ZZU3_9ACTN|nr:ABC transporter ATP-binding protein [Actinomadura rugatobispora]
MSGALLEIENLSVDYRLAGGSIVHAVRDVSLSVAPGETVAVVGESGSGKTTTAHAVVGLLPAASRIAGGHVRYAGEDLLGLSARRSRALRGREIGLVPQDPSTSLNPVKRIGDQVAEVLIVHGLAGRREAREKAVAALADAGLPDPEVRAMQYPHELSGGMRQRVLIAIAVVAEPRLIVADEPTSALDVTVQRRILDHIAELSEASGSGVLLITHDLGVAAERAQRVVVMSGGRAVEEGAARDVLSDPRHDYTRRLIAAAPSLRVRPARVTEPEPAEPAGPGGPVEAARDDHVVVEGLVKRFRAPRAAGGGEITAVDGVGFAIPRGRTFALVGESGSGKTTTARMVLRLADPTAGRIVLGGEDVTAARGRRLRALRRRMQVVYQNPYVSLNPRLTVGGIITDPLEAFGVGTRRERRARAAELLDAVALPAGAFDRRPAELSGGQRQRVAIARALALEPELIVCDEPVSALDVSVQAQILDLLRTLQDELGLTYLFISHDLAVVSLVAHRVGVMRRGRLVESGPAGRVLDDPRDPYTQELLAAIPGRPRN